MKVARGPLLVAAAVIGALATLTLNDGEGRVWWFRGLVVGIGVLALRALIRWLDAQPGPPPGSPFRRRRRRRRGTAARGARHGTARTLHLAQMAAGDAHRGLRPLLREIADERLRSTHGVSIDDPGAREHLAEPTWELLRGDRPAPHDLRAPGLSPTEIDALLTDLEAL